MANVELSEDIRTSISVYANKMLHEVKLVLNTGNHEKRPELSNFLASVASASDNIVFEERDIGELVKGPISFIIETNKGATGITFSGIPSGHEFNSLILAILQSGGVEIKLDQGLQSIIKNIDKTLNFEVFVSLSCQNCPEVVQVLNEFALLNENITSEMIDGGLFQDIIKEKKISGVPSVYLNGELFASGRVETATLIEKLQRLSNTQSLDNSTAIETQDVVIAGGGPAGISAAIYAARKGFKVTLIAQTIGGQLKDTMGIENFISVPKTTGPELSTALQKHMNTYGITVKQNLSVSSIEDNDLKRTILTSGEVIESKTLIIATGAQWRKLNLPGEEENIGNGVAYCPHCDGPFFKGKDVAVIGGGNSGLEASIDLSGIANSVTVFEFLDELKADQVLIDRAGTRDNIKIKTGVETTQIISSGNGVSGIEYRERGSGDIHTQTLSGIFVQIGLVPNSSFIANVVDTNSYGEIIIDDSGNTSAKGIFACGDVTTVPHKQIIISMGDGAKAAIAAADYLQS